MGFRQITWNTVDSDWANFTFEDQEFNTSGHFSNVRGLRFPKPLKQCTVKMTARNHSSSNCHIVFQPPDEKCHCATIMICNCGDFEYFRQLS